MDSNSFDNAPAYNYLKEGDKFRPVLTRMFTTKAYNRAAVKILTDTGEVKFSSSGNIVKILSTLSDETAKQTVFEVYKMSEYNGHPVLSLRTEDKAVNQKILEVLF